MALKHDCFMLWRIAPDQVKFPTCYTYLVLPSGEYEYITDVALFTDSPDGRTLRARKSFTVLWYVITMTYSL